MDLTEAGIEALGEDGSLSDLLALLATRIDPELAPVRLEAVAVFQMLHPDLPEPDLIELQRAVTAAHPEPTTQCVEVIEALQQARAASLTQESVHSWPLELWAAAVATRTPTRIAELAALSLEHAALRAPLLDALVRRTAPRKSKARTRIEQALTQLGDTTVLAAWKQQRRWRGLLQQDASMPLLQRLENWVWAADEVYGIPSEFTPQQRGMYITMLKELCGVRTPDEWRIAVDYFTDENFHGLAGILEPRATPES